MNDRDYDREIADMMALATAVDPRVAPFPPCLGEGAVVMRNSDAESAVAVPDLDDQGGSVASAE